jgi:hypothetical protein
MLVVCKSFFKIRAVLLVYATWPLLIKAAIEDSSISKMQAEEWIGSIAMAWGIKDLLSYIGNAHHTRSERK